MAYWLNLFTVETWEEFKAAGGEVTGFRRGRWSRAEKIRPGDRLLCYVVGAYRWIAILEVTGDPYLDEDEENRIWAQDMFPVRIPVKAVHELTPETAVPVVDMLDDLTITGRMENKSRWGTQFMGSPQRWLDEDGDFVTAAVASAESAPVSRALPRSAQRGTAEVLETESGLITLPLDDDEDASEEGGEESQRPAESEHTRIQLLLARMGSAMGYDVYVPMSDRRRTWQGEAVGDVPNMLDSLRIPLVDQAVRIIREIDVLWIERDAVQAAFEVEKTTSIYSGLLRMTDLLAMQPNLDIQCFIVAPDERRQKVYEQINRATFARMRRPLSAICRYLSFSALLEQEGEARRAWRHLRFSYVLEELAESMEPQDL